MVVGSAKADTGSGTRFDHAVDRENRAGDRIRRSAFVEMRWLANGLWAKVCELGGVEAGTRCVEGAPFWSLDPV
jgi:hypothetical protein